MEKFSKLTEGNAFVFRAAPIDGVGLGGWKLQLQDFSGTNNIKALQEIGDLIVDEASKHPEVYSLQNAIRSAVPQVWLDVDRKKVKSMNVDLEDVFDTLSIYIGGDYINDLTLFGQSFQVRRRLTGAIVRRRKISIASAYGTPKAKWCRSGRW